MAQSAPSAAYSAPARFFHWITVLFIVAMVPVGIVMVERGEQNIWDSTTNALYSGHKLAGFTLLFILVARLVYRLIKGAPPHDPGMPVLLRIVASVTHWAIYALMFGLVLSGWMGVSLFPALDIFGLFSLPGLVSPNQSMAENAFAAHKVMGIALFVLVAMHTGAALFHHFILKDGTLRRMLPKKA